MDIPPAPPRSQRRDYTGEIINSTKPDPQSSTEITAARANNAEKSRKKRVINSSLKGLVLLLLAGGGIGVWWYLEKEPNPIPQNIRQSVNFPVYYPLSIPTGYHLDESSIKVSNGILFYSFINTSSDNSITMSLQSISKDFDPKNILRQQVVSSTSTPVGTAYDLSTNKTSRFMVTADGNVLIFANSQKKIDSSIIQSIAITLKP